MLKFVTDLFKPSAPKPPAPITSETSMNFDAEEVAPFLTRLANNPRFEFAAKFAEAVSADLIDTPVEETRRLRINGSFDGQAMLLEIEAFMDDIEAPDLYFFSTQSAIEEIERELDAFAQATGK